MRRAREDGEASHKPLAKNPRRSQELSCLPCRRHKVKVRATPLHHDLYPYCMKKAETPSLAFSIPLPFPLTVLPLFGASAWEDGLATGAFPVEILAGCPRCAASSFPQSS